jgi:heat shock protein HslJ
MKRILLLLIVMLSLQSCVKEFSNRSFSKNSWMLRKLNGQRLPPKVYPYLSFDGKKIWGSFACNTYEGTAIVNSNVLKFENISNTKQICEGLSEEQSEYLSLLQKVNGAEVVGSTMYFYVGRKRVMVFYKSPLQANRKPSN